jgi:hypothetical protein
LSSFIASHQDLGRHSKDEEKYEAVLYHRNENELTSALTQNIADSDNSGRTEQGPVSKLRSRSDRHQAESCTIHNAIPTPTMPSSAKICRNSLCARSGIVSSASISSRIVRMCLGVRFAVLVYLKTKIIRTQPGKWMRSDHFERHVRSSVCESYCCW